jgi:hypothetical protein
MIKLEKKLELNSLINDLKHKNCKCQICYKNVSIAEDMNLDIISSSSELNQKMKNTYCMSLQEDTQKKTIKNFKVWWIICDNNLIFECSINNHIKLFNKELIELN